MEFGGLIDCLTELESGDLTAAVKAIDEATRLAGSDSGGDRARHELLHHVIEKLTSWMRDGYSEDWETVRETMVSALRDFDAPEKERQEDAAGGEDADYDLVVSFVSESRAHLEDIESRLLSMEKNRDPELVNGVFRSIHTIKGVSSFLGLPRVKNLSHAMETALDEVRSGQRPVTEDLIDVLLGGSDILGGFIDALDSWIASADPENPGRLEEPDIAIDAIMGRLESPGSAEEAPGGAGKAPEAAGSNESDPPPDDSAPLYTPEMLENFARESSDIIDAVEKALMDLDDGGGRESLDEAFRGIHTVKGNAGFFELGEIENFCQSLETVMDPMRREGKAAGSGTVNGLLSGLDALRGLFDDLLNGGASDDDKPKKAGKPRNLGGVLVEMGAVSPDDIDVALAAQDRRIGEILVDNGVVTENKVREALKVQAVRNTASAAAAPAAGKRDVRVDTGRLDQLFTLIGELITAHAMVANSPDIVGKDLPVFEKAAGSMGKIIREVQTLSMSIRMIPLDGLFSKMRRLTRDLARKFGKSVEFRSEGEDTEMDRQIIEQISDPLVHLVRNSIDHGLESSAERAAAGKEKSGIVRLEARYEGNEVWISVRDDGAGLSREKILSRASERGLDLGGDDGASMDDKSVWSLIFEPGFSTAEEVSDVSGRGVGMDVVRQNIEKLRGQVSVESEEGSGTTVTLQIPMTLAIIDGITFRTGGILFALAIADILEFYRPDEEAITEAPGGRRVLRLREELLPVITMEDYYGLVSAPEETGRGVFIILGSGERSAAVPADEILGNQQLVIKPLPDRLKSVRALSGCAILGNGDVCLILDVGYILSSELDGSRR